VTNVYSPQDNIEANIIKGLLEANGIPASISGHYLSGGIGELPAMGLISIHVDEPLVEKAKQLISEYEQA
jgi:hypothetical protein